MRAIEIRRHSVRDKPDPHLTASGRALAVEVGRSRGPFRRVVSSPSPRAVETAEAMTRQPVEPREIWADLGDAEALWPSPFPEYRRALAGVPAVRRVADRLADEVDGLLQSLDDGDRALVVTHGGFPELIAARLGPNPTFEDLGGPCRCLEGVLLEFGDSPKACVEALRVPPERTRL